MYESRQQKGRSSVIESLGQWTEWVLEIGYVGIVVALVFEGLGLPFPGDVVLALYGFAAAEGRFHPLGVAVCSFAGYLLGAAASYRVGRLLGARDGGSIRRLLLVPEPQWRRCHHLVERYGVLLLIPGRFLPGVRSVSSYIAGASGMRPGMFFPYTAVGAALWCTCWVAVGYWFGEHLDTILRVSRSGLGYVTLAAVAIALGIWWTRRRVRS